MAERSSQPTRAARTCRHHQLCCREAVRVGLPEEPSRHHRTCEGAGPEPAHGGTRTERSEKWTVDARAAFIGHVGEEVHEPQHQHEVERRRS